MNWILNLIPSLLKRLGEALALLFVYKKGKDSEKLKQKDSLLKERERADEITKDNAIKSDATILGRLRKQFSRKER